MNRSPSSDPGLRPGGWVTTVQWSRWESVNLFGLHDGGRQAWALSNRGRDKLALVRFDLSTGAEAVAFESPEVDLDSVTLSRLTREPLVAHYMPGYPERKVVRRRAGDPVDRPGGEPACGSADHQCRPVGPRADRGGHDGSRGAHLSAA
ncbi:MAG: hypothetical protein HEQ37_08645 [Acidovorax sp.]|nr:hypothetical protein [Acidovorax sp.]